MRVTYYAKYDINGNLVNEVVGDYDGPLALCDRSQSKQVANQGMQQSAQDQANAQTAFGGAQKANAQYMSGVNKFISSNPYTNPQYKTNLELQNAASAAGSQGSTADQLTSMAGRTRSLNAGQTNAAAEEMQRQNARDRVTANSGIENDLATKGAAYNAEGLGMLNAGASQEGNLYGAGISGSSGQLGSAANAAKTPGFWDTMLPAMVQATGTAVAGACPAEGSKYLMADGSEKLAEDLEVGDQIQGIDDEPQTIEEIQSSPADILCVVTEDGHVARNSRTHAYALPRGGFVVAARALGKTIVTARGSAKVIAVEDAGVEMVYNVITDGSHTYRADGIWALGVGEAERHVSMEAWARIGHSLSSHGN